MLWIRLNCGGIEMKKRFASAMALSMAVMMLAFPGEGAKAWAAKDSEPGENEVRVRQVKATGNIGKIQALKPGSMDENATGYFVEKKLQQMTLEEKVGQIFMIYVYGDAPEDNKHQQVNLEKKRGGKNFKEAIEKYHPGGIIYFEGTGNIGSPVDVKQVNALSNGLQKIAMNQPAAVPLLVATDQEGGVVAAVREPATVFPGNMALGATRSKDLALRSAQIMGLELRSLGVNMDFAPVADVNVNPRNPIIGVRSYSSNADLVSEMAVAQIKGFQQNVIATAKHFPGHGDTEVDSHSGLPMINHDLKTLQQVDLKPFKAAINSGVDAIMTAHIVVPALDSSGLPATLSKPVLTGLLRNELGFKGVIVTDSLHMAGANVLPPDRVPVEAFKAGADILLDPPDVGLAYDAVLNAVKNGEISRQRLDESVARILKVKVSRGLFESPYADASMLKNVGTAGHQQVAEEIASKSITLLKNEKGLLPLSKNEKVFVTGPSLGNPVLLSNDLKEKGMLARSYAISLNPTIKEINEALAGAQDSQVIIVTSCNATTNSAQQNYIRIMTGTGKKVVLAAMISPYDASVDPRANACVLTYYNGAVSVNALARVLAGEASPVGKLPVTIPGVHEYGYGFIGSNP